MWMKKNKMLNKIKNLIDVHGLKNRFLLVIFHGYIRYRMTQKDIEQNVRISKKILEKSVKYWRFFWKIF